MIDHHQIGGGVIELGVVRQDVPASGSTSLSLRPAIFISTSENTAVRQSAQATLALSVSASQSVGVSESTSLSADQSVTIIASESTNVTQSVPVNTNDPPSAALTDSSTSGTQVTWDATGSTDPNGNSLKFRFDFTNNGTYDTVFQTSGTITHDYGTQGTFTAKVQVDDGRGGRDTATHTVSVFGTN